MESYIDFETYYDGDYTLKKMTTTEYIRDPRFQIIGVSVAKKSHTIAYDEPAKWFTGAHWQIANWLREKMNIEDSIVVAHNCMFDAAILEWVLGIKVKSYQCTMMLSRVHDVPFTHSMSLANLAKYHGLESKGHEVMQFKGYKREDFNRAEMASYAAYCMKDVNLCRKLYDLQKHLISPLDRHMNSLTVRKFVKPQLGLDYNSLQWMLKEEEERRVRLLNKAGILDPKELRSNKKFANLLMAYGVDIPMKISPTTGKETHAFAKTDEGMQELLEHPNEEVRTLTEARIGVKTSLMESRLKRFIKVAECNNNMLPFPLLYFGAHTGRMSGWDKLNVQNLPAREDTSLRSAVVAPIPSKSIVAGDLSQIEARISAVLAGCDPLIQAFTNKEDAYVKFASKLFGKPEAEITKPERFVGKTAILGLQYQCGKGKFGDMLRIAGVDQPPEFAELTVNTYRNTYSEMMEMWQDCHRMIHEMWLKTGDACADVRYARCYDCRLELPGGRVLYYPELEQATVDGRIEYTYLNNKGVRVKIYGGKLFENIVQALAQMVIRDAELRMMYRHGLFAAGQLHDELIYVVDDDKIDSVVNKLQECLTTQPMWINDVESKMGIKMPDLPLECEIAIGKTYADCK